MKTYLVVDKLAAEPGLYGIEASNKQLEKVIVDSYPAISINLPSIGLSIPIKLIVGLFQKGKLTKVLDLRSHYLQVTEQNNDDILFDKAIILHSELLNGKYYIEDNRIFDGVFKKTDQIREILPSNRLSELIIINKSTAKKYFEETENLISGLNVADENNKVLIPLPDYSNRKWSMLSTGMCHIFPYLGAKRIMIKDCTDMNYEIESNLRAKASKFGTNYSMKRKFEIEETFSDYRYEPNMVKDKIFMLNAAPHIKQKAKDLIQSKRNSILKFTESIDVSFGLSVDMLVCFQGAFKGGFKREFNVELEF